ncbi:MAG: peptide chain release factor 1 [Candidatus Parcubacteria bacterium]|nr:MAG: peptide chain release factor 1 [Candidatus Parcubacteria bacterium]
MYQEIKEQFKNIETRLSDPVLLADQKEYIKTSQQHSALKGIIEKINQVEKITATITDYQEIINQTDTTDSELKELAQSELSELEKNLNKLKEEIDEELFPADPHDVKNAIVEIRAGAGGDEAALFAGDLFHAYSKFAENNNLKIELLDSHLIGVGGYKEVIFSVVGRGAYGFLKYEAGTHRVQRVPETEKQGRVHTSTATVVVLPEAEEVDIELKMSDLRIDTFCSSGPGGQSVNTTYSAIRIVHIPTGITVSCQDQKSQHQNKEKALQILRSRLLAKEEEERQAKESSARKDQVGSGDRSDKIRTYNFPQDRVTDHRIGESWHSLNLIMAGELEPIIDALKKAAKAKRQNNALKNH